MNKTIWMMWNQGWDKAPDISLKCVESWKYYNPDWKVVLLDSNNINDYIPLDKELPGLNTNNISLGDIVRLSLMKHRGGVWADATVFCNKPLENWAPEGTFLFSTPMKGRRVASWFMKAEKDSYIMDKWYSSMVEWWRWRIAQTDQYEQRYGWIFDLFDQCYINDLKFAEIWDAVLPISCRHDTGGRGIGPHFFCPYDEHFYEELTEEVKSVIDLKIHPVYKLSYKTNTNWRNEKCRGIHPSDEKITINYLEGGSLDYLLHTVL
jgi:hypothetical protein